MEFDPDAFISYAHLDNVELVEGRKGWVANLHRALELRIAQLMGKQAHIFRDPKLAGNDVFADTLIRQLQRSGVLVSVITPRYVRSEWTLRELREFCATAETRGGMRVGDRARIFKVLKTPVPREQLPPQLQQVLGYEFFTVDPETGNVHELDEVFGPDAQREFWMRLYDLAEDVCDLLRELEPEDWGPPPGIAAGSPAGTSAAAVSARAAGAPVYLAETSSDLRDERDALRRDLQQHGWTVLPERPLPLVADEAEDVIRECLGRSRMSVHMIGRSYSVVPEGGRSSLVELQHELATERARGDGFQRLLWIPAGLQVEDERQQTLIERLRADRRVGPDADLLETFFEDVRTVVHQWLDREPAAPPAADEADAGGATPQLYLIADAHDAEAIRPWDDALFQEGLEVVPPLFDGDEADIRTYHEESLAACDGVVIFWGGAGEAWVRRKLREIRKSPGYGRTGPLPASAIFLLPPRSPDKERFRTHDALVVPQWDGLEPAAWRDFTARLKAGRPD